MCCLKKTASDYFPTSLHYAQMEEHKRHCFYTQTNSTILQTSYLQCHGSNCPGYIQKENAAYRPPTT